jgi:arylsulfatase A-like enzyme
MPDAEGNFAFHLNEYVDLYDSGLAYQDTILGGLLDAIDLSDTLVMVVADHGESLGEHGGVVNLTHATGVFDAQSRIPFLISGPGLDPRRIEEIVENVDLLPTTLDLLEITPPTRFSPEGSSLAPLLHSERRQVASEIAFTGTWPHRRQGRTGQAIFKQENPLQLDPNRTVVAARSARWKLMVFPGRGRDWVALYDLEADPGERTNVADDYPEIRDRLLQRSALWLAQPDEPVEEMELTSDEIEKLRALGYVE